MGILRILDLLMGRRMGGVLEVMAVLLIMLLVRCRIVRGQCWLGEVKFVMKDNGNG